MDKRIKQRCVGAIVLIIFAVVLIPIVFHNNSIRTQHISVTKTIPPEPLVTKSNHKIDSAKKLIAKQDVKIKQQHQVMFHSSRNKSQLKQQQWFVQLATFRDKQHAENIYAALQRLDVNGHIISKKQNSGSMLYQVLVGPFSTQTLAKIAKKQLAGQLKLTGLVISGTL